jgi:superoxide dismutase
VSFHGGVSPNWGFAATDSASLRRNRWEHAYYIDYVRRTISSSQKAYDSDSHAPRLNLLQKNVKATYLDNIWSVINWKKAEERLASA